MNIYKIALRGNLSFFREHIDEHIFQTYKEGKDYYKLFLLKAIFLGYEHYLECIKTNDERLNSLKNFVAFLSRKEERYLQRWFENFENSTKAILERIYYAYKDGELKLYRDYYKNMPFMIYVYLEMVNFIDDIFSFMRTETDILIWYALMIYNFFKLPWVSFTKGYKKYFIGRKAHNYHKYKLNLIMHFVLYPELYYQDGNKKNILEHAIKFFEEKLSSKELERYIEIILSRVNYWKNVSYNNIKEDRYALSDFPFWQNAIFFTNLKVLYILDEYQHLPMLARLKMARIL